MDKKCEYKECENTWDVDAFRKGKRFCSKKCIDISYRINNREIFKATSKKYYHDNRESIRRKDKEAYDKNPQYFRDRANQYYKNNPEKVKEYNKNTLKLLREQNKEFNDNHTKEEIKIMREHIQKTYFPNIFKKVMNEINEGEKRIHKDNSIKIGELYDG